MSVFTPIALLVLKPLLKMGEQHWSCILQTVIPEIRLDTADAGHGVSQKVHDEKMYSALQSQEFAESSTAVPSVRGCSLGPAAAFVLESERGSEAPQDEI